MKTAIVGGGKGCRSLLQFILERGMTELQLDVRLVCDLRSHAPGVLYAAERGIRTCSRVEEIYRMPGLELIVELTGDDSTTEEIRHRMPPGVRMMDHALARIFWDLIQLEQSVRREQRQAQNILDSMPDIVLVLDMDMRIETVNAGFTRYTGIPRNMARGQLCHQALCRRESRPDDSDQICPFEQVVETGKRVTLVQVREYAPGLEEHFEITMTPIRGRSGQIHRVVEALHPISERVRLSREVEQAAQQFGQFVESAHDLISIKDLEGRYQVINTATAELFGVNADECLGKTVHELYPMEIARLVSEHDRLVITGREAITFEETLVILGREHHLNTTRYPLFDYKRDVVGVCTISRDVTEERRLQSQLVHADKLAAIGKLAAGVAHEINNPLTGILAYAEDLLQDAEEDSEQAEDYRVIIRETLRCREIVRNLLDFSRQQRPRIEVARLRDVVEKTFALVGRLALFRQIEITRHLAEEELLVAGDAQQLQQVLLNLMVNAAEGMDGKGRIEIRTGRDPGDRSCHILVSDDGPGIRESAKGRIFEPFFSTKTATQGLGLAVSWGIVERHGGRIEAENRPEGGAEFRVVLPAAEV